MKAIKTVGVVGAGTMGAAIAQKIAQEGFDVILADRAMNYIEKGLGGIRAMLDEAAERKVMTKEQAEAVLKNISGTDKLTDLKSCDLVIEAIFENFDAKVSLFRELNSILPGDCIIASNTSSYSIGELAQVVDRPSRFIGMHFFYHAAKNRLLEIIPGKETSAEVLEAVREFTIMAGKDPIECSDRNGFAVNRFFVPWLNESVRIFEEGIASKEVIDEVCCKLFGIGMGPFALMNATGVPVAYHSEKTLETFGSLYKVAPLLEMQALSGKPWELNNGGEQQSKSPVPAEVDSVIRERMLSVVFFVCSQIFDEKVCSAAHLNRGARIGLRWRKGPVELMKIQGVKEVKRLVELAAKRYRMDVPLSVKEDIWVIKTVSLAVNGANAVITMDDPESMNALNVDSVRQLEECFDKAANNPSVKTIFITGSGKAFVAGADIKFFVNNIKNKKIEDIESFTASGQALFEKIDSSPKKVVAVLNGLALGGGLELALCADIILALPKVQLAFPETGIGIYPGLGGTQRSARKIGKGLAKYLVLTGKMLSAREAEEMGLVDKMISAQEMFSLFRQGSYGGNGTVPSSDSRKDGTKTKKWQNVEQFFERNSYDNIRAGTYDAGALPPEEANKISNALKKKAPVALKIANELIDEAKGCSSELQYLAKIFTTSDALLGLTSIGKSVEFAGK